MKAALSALRGAVLATALIVSCNDDSPADADAAAACECPAAEPPVPTRIMTIRGTDGTVNANANGSAFAMCPAGAKFLSGGCVVDDPSVNDVQLWRFRKLDGQEGFECVWLSHHPASQTVHAEVTCLVP